MLHSRFSVREKIQLVLTGFKVKLITLDTVTRAKFASPLVILQWAHIIRNKLKIESPLTLFFFYKNIFYKNIEAEICENLRIF